MQAVVVGEEEAVLGFALIGVEGRIAVDPAGAAVELQRVLDSGEAPLVFVTETVARWVGPEIAAAVARGALIQAIAAPRTAEESRARDPEAELLAALGLKL
jgi:vacuolar-type H+-ATPase subunit F/Vma7